MSYRDRGGRYGGVSVVKFAAVATVSLLTGFVVVWPLVALHVSLVAYVSVVGASAILLSRQRIPMQVVGTGLYLLAAALALTPLEAYVTLGEDVSGTGALASQGVVAEAQVLLTWGVACGALALVSWLAGRQINRAAEKELADHEGLPPATYRPR